VLIEDCLLARNWQQQSRLIFLWQQILLAVGLALGLYASSVRSGGADLNTRDDQTHQSQLGQIFGGANRSATDAGSRLNLEECRSFSPASRFGALVMETAHSVGVEPRALVVRALLHLPRVASYEGWVTRRQIRRELTVSAEQLSRDVRAASSHVAVEKFSLHDLCFEEIDAARALPVLTSLHYLRSARPKSLYFGLVDPVDKLPVSICSMSPLQWSCVGRKIQSRFAISPDRVWDISRLYSVDCAPHNSISTLLSRIRTYMRHNISGAELLITAVDPNLGFSGCSYRAANWKQWMTVRARPYFYENGHYMSPRQLRERYGTSSLVELRAKYPERRFQQSNVRLLDSMIYCWGVNEKTKAFQAQEIYRLHR
jgi:hypothetical protein